MAQITYLVGNGFDLNLGLNTKYSDFIDKYVELPSDNELIEWFKGRIDKDKQQWSDAEIAFGSITEEFRSLDNSSESFNRCQIDFCTELANYLKKEQERLKPDKIAQQQKHFQKVADCLVEVACGLKPEPQKEVQERLQSVGDGYKLDFMVFNYTSTLEMILQPLRTMLGIRVYNNSRYSNELHRIVHVHGTVEEDMILGVNDISQIKAPEIFDEDGIDLSAMIKEETNALCERNREREAISLIEKSDIIYIYGMSIGETDRRWWERIIHQMMKKPHLCVIIGAYDAPDNSLVITPYIKYKKRKQEEFLSFEETLSDEQKEELAQRIYIDSTNKFSEIKDLVSADS